MSAQSYFTASTTPRVFHYASLSEPPHRASLCSITYPSQQNAHRRGSRRREAHHPASPELQALDSITPHHIASQLATHGPATINSAAGRLLSADRPALSRPVVRVLSSSKQPPASPPARPRTGRQQEDLVRRYADERLLSVSRRYVKKFGSNDGNDSIVGFNSASELCRSSTPLPMSCGYRARIPFLLRLASDFTQYIRSFPPAPRATFALLRKLDHCFASLLGGQDIDSAEPLPGFENGLRAGMTVTDMVRCRSLVEQTRVLMVELMSQGTEEEEEEDEDESETDTDNGLGGAQESAWDTDEERLHMDAARVYEQTIVKLGDRLGEPLVGENAPTNDLVLDI
ncbi:hypothetical protein ACCO45_012350 [Purpureocillium lilacinum]|uniref:Uncharacterized protein n=1 Tax=Purpureocillium lilacinum TaxID=33203 RepID=A0ACC4D8H1_PURLI